MAETEGTKQAKHEDNQPAQESQSQQNRAQFTIIQSTSGQSIGNSAQNILMFAQTELEALFDPTRSVDLYFDVVLKAKPGLSYESRRHFLIDNYVSYVVLSGLLSGSVASAPIGS